MSATPSSLPRLGLHTTNRFGLPSLPTRWRDQRRRNYWVLVPCAMMWIQSMAAAKGRRSPESGRDSAGDTARENCSARRLGPSRQRSFGAVTETTCGPRCRGVTARTRPLSMTRTSCCPASGWYGHRRILSSRSAGVEQGSTTYDSQPTAQTKLTPWGVSSKPAHPARSQRALDGSSSSFSIPWATVRATAVRLVWRRPAC